MVPREIAVETCEPAWAAFNAFGSPMRPDKTQAWGRRAACQEGLEQCWHAAGVTLICVLLGEPIPHAGLPDTSAACRVDIGGENYVYESCREGAERACILLRRIAELPALASPHIPAVQLSAALLRMCGFGEATHLLFSACRMQCRVRPHDCQPRCFHTIGRHAMPTAPVMRGRGPASQGALDPTAWLALWAHTLSEVILRTNIEALASLDMCDLPIAQHCRGAIVAVPSALANDLDDANANPSELSSWAPSSRRKVQKTFCGRLDQQLYVDPLSPWICKPKLACLHTPSFLPPQGLPS